MVIITRQSMSSESQNVFYDNFYVHSRVCVIKVNYVVNVDVHKCGAPPSHHPGQSVHRLNTPSMESQWWA